MRGVEMMKRDLTFCIVAVIALGQAERAWAKLEIGEKAPPIKIKKWVKGQEIDPTNSGGKFVMLEFWATWCGPCKATMPHLSELQKKYESAGLVVVGVSREEVKVVEPFAKDASNKMEYTVAVDDRDDTWNKYMNGVGAMGIPYAFLVDRQGNLAWHGSPRDQHLEDLLTEIAKGTYDPERFAEKMRKVKRYEEYIELKAPQRALGLIDELIA
ncbi:MAG: TlpA disulfide reductase family protein, partial [bacterium]